MCGSSKSTVNFSSKSSVLAVGGFAMDPLLMVCLSAGVPFAGVALLKLQARLERWDHERHVED
jgi:hypothetical protein